MLWEGYNFDKGLPEFCMPIRHSLCCTESVDVLVLSGFSNLLTLLIAVAGVFHSIKKLYDSIVKLNGYVQV